MKNTLAFLVLSAAMLALAGCGGDDTQKAESDVTPVPVHVTTIQRAKVPLLCEVPGTVRPRNQAVVSARVMGTVAVADFAIGQTVTAGQALVILSAPEMAARVDQAQAALDKAKRDYEREAGLLKSGASTAQTVHDMAERQRMAEAALVEAQSLNSYTKVTAPFDGRITRKLVSAGDFAAPGTPLFEIDGDGGLRVVAQVPESFPELDVGAKLKISADGISSTGTLAEFSPAADPQSRTRLAKVDADRDASLRSGQFVRLMWPVGTMDEILVPPSAVTRYGQIQRVYVVEKGLALMRIVRTGETMDGGVQILSGLNDGEVLVTDPSAGLANDSVVEVVQ